MLGCYTGAPAVVFIAQNTFARDLVRIRPVEARGLEGAMEIDQEVMVGSRGSEKRTMRR